MDVNIYKLKENQLKFFGPTLDEEQETIFEKEKSLRSIGKLRFTNLLAMVTIVLFGIIDYFNFSDNKTIITLFAIRLLFIVAFLLPFYIGAKSKVFKKHPSLYLFINALSLIVFLIVIAVFSVSNMEILLHIYLGMLISIISIHLLIGLRQNLALLISLIAIVIVNLIILGYQMLPLLPFPLISINIWFIICSTLAYLYGSYAESIAKHAFLTNFKLKEENELKNKFFSIVAHDLKNMIATQFSITEYLKDQHNSISAKKLDNMLGILNQSTANAMEVFEDLMHWIKSQLNTITIHRKKTTLKNSIDTIADLMQASAMNKNISIETEINDNASIITDPNLFGLILRNIVGNAIKFSYPDSTIFIKSSCQEQVSEIQVIDEGIGMNQKTIDRIFRLERIESTKGTTGETGTGLGMILSKELVKILNGEIIVSSQLNKGTTISIIIPNS